MNKEILYEYGWFLILSGKMKRSLIRTPPPSPGVRVNNAAPPPLVNITCRGVCVEVVEGLRPLRTLKGEIH